MDIVELREYTLCLNGVTEDMPFGEDGVAFRIGGKIFMYLWLVGDTHVAMKLPPEMNEDLRERCEGVKPAYHWNKKYWSDVYLDKVRAENLKKWIQCSYNVVLAKLPKKEQSKYKAK